jgi:nicotinic acid mononucleotide adenylyltransferase
MLTLSSFIKLTEKEKVEPTNKKVAVFTFGRFNPPTKGHQKLIDKTIAVAKEKGGEHFIFPSQTVDKKKDPEKSKNPLDWDTKVSFMKQLFPKANISKVSEVITPHHVIDYLEEKGFTDIYFVVGSDRVEDFEARWVPYAKEIFNTAGIVSAGSRDPDAEGISGMSATKARDAAKEGNVGKFRAATGWSGSVAEELMNAVKNGMGVE